MNETNKFILPQKWCVKRTSETATVINHYFSNLTDSRYEFIPYPNDYDYIHSEHITTGNHPHVRNWNGESSKEQGFTEITFEQFKKYVVEEKEEFELPCKWCIKIDTYENPAVVATWRKDIVGKGGWSNSGYLNETGYHTHSKPSDRIEITLEQFKQHVYNGRELLGYKVPINLYGGEVKKDDIYVPAFNTNYYKPLDKDDENIVLPKEIVETWEAVYKEDEDFKVGDIIVITACPNYWSSRYSNKDIRNEVKYPFTTRIDKMDKEAMLAGNGGWALDRLMESKTIRKATEIEIAKLKENEHITLSNDKVVTLQYNNNSFKIIAEDEEIKYDVLKRITFDSDKVNSWPVKLISGTYTIGCWTVTLEDIKLIIEKYKTKSSFFNKTI